MKFDTVVLAPKLDEMPALTRAAEAIGFDGLWTGETSNNPFLPLVLAAEHSQKLALGTAIAVAFPRTPTVLAHIAWDLARYSKGRFILGLGAQVRAHNERRLGVTWAKPIRRMRETIEAMHAIWDAWQEGTRLNYQGEFFQLNLMTPFFSGAPLEVPRPPIYISAINGQMLRLAGQVCDGVHLHVLHSVKYLKEYAWPHIEEGLRRRGKSRADFTAAAAIFAIPTDGRQPASDYETMVREQLSFYMSTPAYRTVVELHGWSDTAQQLSQLARQGDWDKMPGLIDDVMLDTFAVTGKWRELPGLVKDKYGRLLDRTNYYLPFVPGEEDEGWRETVQGFKAETNGD
jgi:probable F420-dependent oxidoreductase